MPTQLTKVTNQIVDLTNSKTPPQDGLWIFLIAILDNKENNREEGRALVKISTNWWVEWIGISRMRPWDTVSLMKWQSISICLVLSWKIGLEAMCMVAWLSQKSKVEVDKEIWKSVNNCQSHNNSLAVAAIALYSASAEEWDIVDYFLDFHETNESPRKTRKPVVDFLESEQDAQSASKRACNYIMEEDAKNNPWPGADLMYLKRWRAACKWGVLGWDRNWLSLWTANIMSGLDKVR